MLASERRSLIRFLAIYLASTFLLFALASWIFYTSGKHHLIDQQQKALTYEADKLKSTLRRLHQSSAPKLYYPGQKDLDSAIYDLDGDYIFGTYPHTQPLYEKTPGRLSHIEKVEPYYLGAAYLKLTRAVDTAPVEALRRNILLFMLAGGIFFSVLGYFLGKLFIAPMREAIGQMNRFIQDTTHELNTPISTILTNIEMIETLETCPKVKEELNRIEIASKTLSRIYDDLTYLNLNHDYHRHIVRIDMGALVKERVGYFGAMAEARKITLYTEIDESVILQIDKNDALRLIDNLLSNAIKYNRPEGRLKVLLKKDRFVVEDFGVGISAKKIKEITRRFVRANKSEGGFGIGLDIVHQVVESYRFSMQIESELDKGTKVTIRWEK